MHVGVWRLCVCVGRITYSLLAIVYWGALGGRGRGREAELALAGWGDMLVYMLLPFNRCSVRSQVYRSAKRHRIAN